MNPAEDVDSAATPPAPDEAGAAPAQASAAPPAKAPGDSNDLLGFHFKRLMGKRATLLGGGIPTVVIAIALAFGNVLWLPIILVLGLVITSLVCFLLAVSRAREDFFTTYAQQRSMTLGGRGQLPPATPLLRRGNNRYAERTLSGPLADDITGTVALYTYEEESTDSEGNRETNYYKYTLGLVEVPECAPHVPELYCQRKFGLRALEKFEDVFRRSKERVKLESEALDDKYEIFVGKGQDANWLRQLFAPTFIVWLTDSAPKKFAFELVDGTLCCYVHGHKEDAEDLDTMRAASAVVTKRLRDESTE